ncbi:MAG: polysaccharide biosynthesis/export family protein [Flavobacterium sp.]|nr:polysaccharide biosynthesis/export family protein [Flavobacterium sp.]
MKNSQVYIYIIFIFILSSCVPKKSIIYFQGNQNFDNPSSNYEPLIQNDDMLYINISSDEPIASEPFNLENQATSGAANNSFAIQKQTYLVDNFGKIDFPTLGSIDVAGYSVNNLKKLLKQKLALYFVKEPVINIRIMNFKVSVLGEVTKPGVINVNSERFTMLEAIAQSGDLTLYGKRNNILVIRDFQGIKTYNRVDITKADFVNSPFYYVDQNDVIYVEPKKSKIDSTAISSNVVSIFSILGFGLTVFLILRKV